MKSQFDLLVIGGGINGVGIARDAAGRGHSVLLVEQQDLAQHTSSASTKLIHGGLRYLEHYDFRLVREALIERERLLEVAPHLVWPLEFVLPHENSPRPAWLVRLGLFLYDHLGGRNRLPASRQIHIRDSPYAAGLKPSINAGFIYSDCAVDDSRLVISNAIDAQERGAEIRTHTTLVRAERSGKVWQCKLLDGSTNISSTISASVVVNAAGPWVSQILRERINVQRAKDVRLVKGSHIIVPRLHTGEHAFMLQNPDRRIVFVIPYEGRYSLVGTTELAWHSQPGAASIDAEEVEYLCESVNRYFANGISARDVVSSYAGVRPLFDDAAKNATAVTRDYVLDIDAPAGQPALLSVFGGKITTYRRLAEHALQKLTPYLPSTHRGAWTSTIPLPGGDIKANFAAYVAAFRTRYTFLPDSVAHRLVRAYGTRAADILGNARDISHLGMHFGAGLYEAEVEYLLRSEWALDADDILQRRSKLILHMNAEDIAKLRYYLQQRVSTQKLVAAN